MRVRGRHSLAHYTSEAEYPVTETRNADLDGVDSRRFMSAAAVSTLLSAFCARWQPWTARRVL